MVAIISADERLGVMKALAEALVDAKINSKQPSLQNVLGLFELF